MIREGKQQGWLHLPVENIEQWSSLQGVQLSHVHFGKSKDDETKGAGLFARQDIAASDDWQTTLLTVPRDLILSRDKVIEHAKIDKDLREVLQCLGEFGTSPRIAILTMLLTQASLSYHSLPERHFVRSPFADYVKFLPMEPLPTFWSDDERTLLTGTTLLPAVSAKMNALYREFDTFRSLTSNLPWTVELWWDDVDGIFTFDDWLQLDAMYRSRALEFPGIGDCMAPAIDMANHASGAATSAIYEVDSDGNGVLLLRPGMSLSKDEEITISYGDAKGACEMLFSYAFLEAGQEANTLFLDLALPSSDPQAQAKKDFARTAPGVKITAGDPPSWHSDWIWYLVAGADDGLQFLLAQTVGGQSEIQASFNDTLLSTAADLHEQLQASSMWEIFLLRAVVLLQDRVAAQLTTLYGCEEEVENVPPGPGTSIDSRRRAQALQLRALEAQLLEETYAHLDEEKSRLASSDVVIAYLTSMAQSPETHEAADNEEEDFS